VTHGHSLQIADVDRDGNLDILAAEMAKWSGVDKPDDNPGATAWIFYGDGKGGFRKTVFAYGHGLSRNAVAISTATASRTSCRSPIRGRRLGLMSGFSNKPAPSLK
jgi:hypothetical protein